MTSNQQIRLLLALSTLLLAACDLPFLNDDEARIEAKREAEGKAVGSGCRYSGRALEDCYGMNPKMSKAAMLAGWRDMDGYMRENNIQIVSPDTGEQKNEEAKPKAAEAPAAEDKAKAVEAPAAADKAKAAAAPPAENKPKSAAAGKDASGNLGVQMRKVARIV